MRSMTGIALAFALVTLGSQAPAATVSLVPPAADVVPGTSLTLDLVVSGLADMGSPSLGGFDVDIGFDPGVLTLESIAITAALGDTAAGDALDIGFGPIAPGVVNVAVVSLLSSAALDAMQMASVVVASLAFTVGALAPGATTVVDVGVLGLTDGLAMPLPVDATAGATLTGAIPLPGAVWLFASALAMLALRARR